MTLTQSLHDRLRHDTADAHRRLDRGLALDGAALSPQRYRRLLSAFLGFIAPWEAQVHLAMPAELRDFFPPDRYARRLRADLAALGAADADAVTRCDTLPALPSLRDHVEALGSAYVFEGSMLGGQLIARAVRATLGHGASDGCAYFTGAGAGTGTRWKAFLDVLDRHVGDDAHARAAGSARNTFVCFERWLARNGLLA